jgi:hypothetical protein
MEVTADGFECGVDVAERLDELLTEVERDEFAIGGPADLTCDRDASGSAGDRDVVVQPGWDRVGMVSGLVRVMGMVWLLRGGVGAVGGHHNRSGRVDRHPRSSQRKPW